ncbi:MAG: hypothetical protein IJI05_05775 [Erysipelotrichaceae bacterium]|nr:hypothetical protein [Erysipelotrichaceae bacterium]
MKKFLTVMMTALLVLALAACGEKTTEYTYDGFSIKIPETYALKEMDTSFDKCWYDENTEVALWVDHYSVEWLEENDLADFTLEDVGYNIGYGEEILSEKQDGNTYEKKYITPEGENYNVFKFANIYQTNDGYWLVVLDCMEEEQAKYEPLFTKWFKTVTIKD